MAKILVVDDSDDDRVLLKLALGRILLTLSLISSDMDEVRIVLEHEASAASKIISESPDSFALVLMDGNFVGQNSNGPEAVASIRKVSDVYIVMTSSEEDLAHQGLLNGANNVITKDEIVKDANILLPLLQELIFKK